MACLWRVYGMCMVCTYVHVYVDVHVHMKVWIAQSVQLTDNYISQYDDVPRKLFEHFANIIQRLGLVWLVLYVG